MTDEPPDGVLTPADLELDDDQVDVTDDGRVVVPTDGSLPSPPTDRGELSELDGTFAVDLALRTEDGTDGFRAASDDVREPFEAMLRWYARRLDADDPPERVLATLLSSTDLALDVDVTSDGPDR